MSDSNEHGVTLSDDIHQEVIYHDSEDKAHSGLNTKVIWRVFWVLLLVTIFEVSISFTSVSREVLLYTFIATDYLQGIFYCRIFYAS